MKRKFKKECKLYSKGMSQEAIQSEIIFESGKGNYLYDINGKEYFDLSIGIFTNSLGQCNEKVVTVLKKQLETIGNVHDCSTSHRYELLKLLNRLTPDYINNFAFSSTGAEAVELALRAVYTFINVEKMKVLTFNNSYHGKTGGVRLINGWRYKSEPYKESCKVDFPNCKNCKYLKNHKKCNFACVKEIERKIKKDTNIKVFLFEPILGAGGIIIPPEGYWEKVDKICKENNVIMIDNEIFMSGGKIGSFLACEKYNFTPDVILMSKGLSSGYPISVVCANKKILSNKYFTGYGDVSATYSSHPFGIEAALATINVILEEKLIDNVNCLSDYVSSRCKEFEKNYLFLKDARSVGVLFAFEFSDELEKASASNLAETFFQKCLRDGIKVSVGGNVIRMCPPLNVKKHELVEVLGKIDSILKEMKEELK